MKRNALFIVLTVLTTGTAWGENLPKDSLKVIDVEEVVVIASPKENRKLREQPTASTLLSQKEMQANQVTSLKSLTSLVPNLFIPDYGSKLTSAIYIRGIGSRINTPSVGLYVDNVPYIDKSAFDFNYADIERIDVLRGPQGTLYGRNTMGGLIKVHTKSPFTYQGTDLRLSAGTYNNYNASVTHYHRTSDKFAFSTGGFYEHAGGFFENAYSNKKIDRVNAGGGRFRGIYLPTANWKLDLNVSYEYSDQGGYAYGLFDKNTGIYQQPAYNNESTYYRGLFNTSLNAEYQAEHFVISSVTGVQNLNDRMFIDQDFSPKDYFTLEQKQKQTTLTEEVILKSRGNKRWEWVTGAFGFYQWLTTDAPVTFGADGVGMLQSYMDKGMPASMKAEILDKTLPVDGSYNTPTLGAAVFHQSTFNDLLVEGLSATVGLRLEYEKIKITHDTHTSLNVQMSRGGVAMGPPINMPYLVDGKESEDYLQLLPKFALKYDFDKTNNIYASVSRGYRSGGYNIQMFSDIIQEKMRSKPGQDLGLDIKNAITYKPEYSWNYEVGTHLTLWKGKLWVDLTAFYMDTQNQQVARFADSGLGRITVNAGKSRSYGAEAALRANLTDALSLTTSYGYTYAVFSDYVTNRKNAEGKLVEVDYNGQYVPFVPKHTLNVGAQYIFKMAANCWLDRVQLNANYSAAGRIYWTEDNSVSQAFYGTLNGRVSLEKGPGAIAFWVRNALDKQYQAFYFESMGNGFMQRGRPMQLGVDLRCRF